MNVRSCVVGVVAVLSASVLVTSGAAVAAPKTGCPVGSEGHPWVSTSVPEAVEKIFGQLVDPVESEAFVQIVSSYDRNDDGDLCLRALWGDDLNPKSHWSRVGVELLGAPTTLFLVRDNNAGA